MLSRLLSFYIYWAHNLSRLIKTIQVAFNKHKKKVQTKPKSECMAIEVLSQQATKRCCLMFHRTQWPGNVEICSHKALMWIHALDTTWLRRWVWCEVRGSAATSWPVASAGWERRDRSPVYPSIWMKKPWDGKMNCGVGTLESRHSWSFLARESCHYVFLMMASALTGQGSITKKWQNPFGYADVYWNHKARTVWYLAICLRFLIPHLATSDIYAQIFF